MKQQNSVNKIDSVKEILELDPAIKSLWLSGSYGRGDADEYSDFDFGALVDATEDINLVFTRIQNAFSSQKSTIFFKTLPYSKTINIIDEFWDRIDITLFQNSDLSHIIPNQIKFIFDHSNMKDMIKNNVSNINVEANINDLKNCTNEFLRVIGLLPVVIGRNELVVAQIGASLLRDLLIKVMQKENNSTVIRGVLSLQKSLSKNQYILLENAPVLSIDRDAVIKYDQYIANIFIPIAKKLYELNNIEWPLSFYENTKKHLQDKLSLELPL